MNSLERSLQVGLVASLVGLMLVFLWAGSLTARLLSESFVHTRLGDEADVLVAALEDPPIALARPRLAVGARLDPDYDRPLSGSYYVVRFEGGDELRSRSAWDQRLPVPELAPGQQLKRRVPGVNGEPLLLWLGGFSRGGQAFTVVLAEDVGAIEARLDVFRWYFAAITLVLLVALLVVQHLIVRRSVDKLDAIRGELERLEHGQATTLSEDVPREIVPLVREFNRLLLRFDQRTRQSRNAVGNLAHSLKGPLNLLLRAAAPDAPERTQADGRAIAQNAERIRHLIESELRRARLAGRSAAGQRFDLQAELPPLTGLLGQIYSDKRVDVRWNVGADVEFLHDRQDMLELIGNLLDNAVKWADSVVMLTLRASGAPPADGVLLDVEDDGPGCSPEELARLTERGVRLDESIAGHGLGLSIVKDIVDTYGGRLELGRSARLGGLRATVRLPAAG